LSLFFQVSTQGRADPVRPEWGRPRICRWQFASIKNRVTTFFLFIISGPTNLKSIPLVLIKTIISYNNQPKQLIIYFFVFLGNLKETTQLSYFEYKILTMC
jgi:hypothetical protein